MSLAPVVSRFAGLLKDIGDWAVHSVTSMFAMFSDASSFNQDLSSWAVDNLNGMAYMFSDASAFDQDLGWCVENYDGYPSITPPAVCD